MTEDRYFCTLFDINYLTRGLALYHSILTNCPSCRLWILCMDEITYEILAKLNLSRVTLIRLSEFEDKELLEVKPTRSHGEYCWTCTASLLLYIFQHYPEVKVLSYLDSDMYFYSSPEPIFEEFGTNSIMIIPHRLMPHKTNMTKLVGRYNVSMVTFRKDKNGQKCLIWWRKKCLEWCYNRYENGKAGDQLYLNSFRSLFKGVHILKHIGAGTASWNIPQYRVWKNNGQIYLDNIPLILYHFQALKIYRPLPFLTSVPIGCYGDRTIYRALIYDQYFKKLYEETKLVRKYIPNFSSGFISRPKLGNYLKEEIIAKLSFLVGAA